MKKNLLTTVFVVLLVALVGSCSTDETLVHDTQPTAANQNTSLTARGNFWAGRLAILNANGTTTFTVDPNQIKADLEEIMAEQGQAVTLQSVFIAKKFNANDAADYTYALIGSDGIGTSIGVLLRLSADGLYLEGSDGVGFDGTVSGTTCRGCSDGCFLEFVRIEGKKAFYCNAAGCGEFCTKYFH